MNSRAIVYLTILVLILSPVSGAAYSAVPLANDDQNNTLAQARATVVINEVMPNPVDEDTGEFVELYNSGVSVVDVGGWYVQDKVDVNDQITDYTDTYDWGLSGTQIPAGGYCLYVDQEYAGEYNGYLNANADPAKVIMVTGPDTTVGNGLTNSGDNATLLDSTMTFIDQYIWSSDPGENVTYGRHPNGGSSWVTYGDISPGAANPPLPDIVINELMYDPDGSDLDGEWVEIYNNGSNPVNMSSWEITDNDGNTFVFPGIDFPADTYIVIHTKDGTPDLDFSDNTANLYFADTSSIWTNTGDDVSLIDKSGSCLDYINYSSGSSVDPPPGYINWTGNIPEVTEGNSLALHPNGWDNNSADDWREETGDNITRGKNNDEIFSVILIPDKIYQQALEGTEVVYNITVKSSGNMDDNIDLAIGSPIPNGWLAELDLSSVHLSPLLGTDSQLVKLTVTAPGSIDMGNMAVINVTATSQNDTLKTDTVSTTTVIPGIDLVVNWVNFNSADPPLEVLEGSEVTVKLSIKNQGELNASGFNVTFYLNTIDDNSIIGTKTYDSIYAGGYKYPSVKWDTLYNPGNHTIYAVLDAEDQVPELDELNNQISGLINVTPTTPNSSELGVMVVEVYYDTNIAYEPNEFVRLANQNTHAINISGWYIADDVDTGSDNTISFPQDTILPPDTAIYITDDADIFYQQSGFRPDFACTSSDGFTPALIQMTNPEDWPGFANSGDEVMLRNANRHFVDVVTFGNSEYYGTGWFSTPSPDVSEGKILTRSLNSLTNQYLDTNTSADWLGPYFPGVGQSNFEFETFEFTGTVTPFASPENTFAVISNELAKAETSLWINIYQFTQLDIAKIVGEQLDDGVEVRIIIEGEPVGWNLSNVAQEFYTSSKESPFTEKYIAHELYKKGAEIKFLAGTKAGGIEKRYRYNHAKYVIIDGETVLLLSGNFKPSSIPTDPSLGYGNREWGAVVHSAEVAEYFANVFTSDWTPVNELRNDTVIFNPAHPIFGAPPDYFQPDPQERTGWYEPIEEYENEIISITEDVKVSPVFSPDTSSLADGSIIGMINSATKSVFVNQADINIDWVYSRSTLRHFLFNWSDEDSRYLNWGDRFLHHNLYLQALIDAAARGCEVNILVDSRYGKFNYDYYEGSQDNEIDNIDTILYVNHLASLLGLESKLEVRLCHLGGLSKVHNKGLIVDGEAVLVSSINWNFNSVMNNREAAMIIENSKVADFYETIFLSDWDRSASVKDPTNPTQDEQDMLVTEIYYDTYLETESEEYIKITNPTTSTVDISGWTLTDQCSYYNWYEGTVLFPVEYLVGPGENVYVARNASAFKFAMGFNPDFEFLVDTDPMVPQLEVIDNFMSSDEAGPSLTNTGDEVILADEFLFFDYTVKDFMGAWKNHTIDVAIYGNDYYITDLPSQEWGSENTILPLDEGMILKRNQEEITGTYIDTNRPEDWVTPRVYYPGQSEFEFESYTYTGTLTTFTSPDTSYQVIISELDKAQSTVYINLYQFHNPFLMDAVLNASNRGVQVKVLLEGDPVGGLSDAGKYVAWKLTEAGCKVRFMISSVEDGIYNRYIYNHAKYAVIDNKTLILGSENWKVSGIPVDPSYGNRGWGVAVHNPELAEYFAEVFMTDFDPSRVDSYPFDISHGTYGVPPEDYAPRRIVYTNNYKPRFTSPTFSGEFTVSPVLSPDTNLLETESVIDLLNSATKSVYIEQLQCYIDWDDQRGEVWREIPNMYLEAAINASRRGCEVKIILDSAFVNIEDDGLDNFDTVKYINDLAEAEGLTDKLEAKLIYLWDSQGLNYLESVHNKGLIVDGTKTLVSSLNWGTGAAMYNRETGVIIEHEGVARFFESVFFYDWNLTLHEWFDANVLYSDTREVTPGNSTEYTISIRNVDTSSTFSRDLELSITGLNQFWDASLSHTNLTLGPGDELNVILTVTSPTRSEVTGYNENVSGNFNISEFLCGLRGHSSGLASDMVFTTTYLKYEPVTPPDDTNGDEPDPTDGDEPDGKDDDDDRGGIDAIVVLIIVIIAVIMGAIMRDYLFHRSERKKLEKGESDETGQDEPSDDEQIEE
jgi:phosphatidylserine/phosphatidylglycerophosphate/cardiolipin synthase-like enzyme